MSADLRVGSTFHPDDELSTEVCEKHKLELQSKSATLIWKQSKIRQITAQIEMIGLQF